VTQGIVDGLNQPYIDQTGPFSVENRSLQTANLSQFDYTFAGLLGFALISLGIFGMANGFASDKKVGAFRRMRVAPIKSWHIIVATGIMYTFVGLLSVAAMFVVAVSFLDFNMRGNILEFLLFAAFGAMCMYGFGMAVAGWARNENQAAPLANLVAFPMMFLSGAFFPRFLMPEWLQSITAYIPLSPIIDGLRRITTENAHLYQLGPELAIIAGWTAVIYLVAFKFFRWE
jgi:ABC-2 type transport system permease protein